MADNTLYQGVRNAAAPPDKMKTGALRACLTCKLLKTMEQFRQDGCDNCGELSGYDTQSYTTPTFKGSHTPTQRNDVASEKNCYELNNHCLNALNPHIDRSFASLFSTL